MTTKNVKLRIGFTQVCVWPGTLVGDQQTEFVAFIADHFNGVRVQYLEEIKTQPDKDRSGFDVEGTGGRNDLFFAVHKNDVRKFAIPRLSMGIRWVEDVLSPTNSSSHLYPARVNEYCSWDASL